LYGQSIASFAIYAEDEAGRSPLPKNIAKLESSEDGRIVQPSWNRNVRNNSLRQIRWQIIAKFDDRAVNWHTRNVIGFAESDLNPVQFSGGFPVVINVQLKEIQIGSEGTTTRDVRPFDKRNMLRSEAAGTSNADCEHTQNDCENCNCEGRQRGNFFVASLGNVENFTEKERTEGGAFIVGGVGLLCAFGFICWTIINFAGRDKHLRKKKHADNGANH